VSRKRQIFRQIILTKIYTITLAPGGRQTDRGTRGRATLPAPAVRNQARHGRGRGRGRHGVGSEAVHEHGTEAQEPIL
jgi:hypothetical protein